MTSVLVVVVGLLLAALTAQGGPRWASTSEATVVRVLDATTLEVEFQDGGVDTLRLIGVYSPPDGGVPTACGAGYAMARLQELVTDSSLRLELAGGSDARDEDGRLPGHVWLADGRNVAELLLRQGAARRLAGNSFHAYSDVFSAAQAAAVADRAGLWAPGACATQGESETSAAAVDRAAVSALVGPSEAALQRARIGANVLREQALSSPAAVHTPGWQRTTAMAVGWLREASHELQREPVPVSTQPLRDDLAYLGSRIQSEADAFARAANTADVVQVQLVGSRLGQTGDLLVGASAELNALALAYGIGD